MEAELLLKVDLSCKSVSFGCKAKHQPQLINSVCSDKSTEKCGHQTVLLGQILDLYFKGHCVILGKSRFLLTLCRFTCTHICVYYLKQALASIRPWGLLWWSPIFLAPSPDLLNDLQARASTCTRRDRSSEVCL